MKNLLKKSVLSLVIFAAIFGSFSNSAFATKDIALDTVTVFFNEACQDCGELVKEFYPGFFEEYGYTLTMKDYINERSNRAELHKFNEDWNVPFELQSHIEAFVSRNLLIGGHVPESIMRYLLENPSKYDKLLVYQDKMHGEETEYKVWDFKGEIKTYPIDEPITTYLQWRKMHSHDEEVTINQDRGFLSLFALISGAAFLDGLNPCAFAVLLFFIAFLFSIKKTRGSIWKMGLTYVFGIYLAYLLIGLGIAQAIVISGAPHLMAYVGAYLVISLGVIQLLGIVFPSFPIKLRIPVNTKATVEKWIFKATIPAAFIGGFIVGLCTFPCSGGIYVAIISMLSISQTYGAGIAWMFWYNIIFISPLLIMLALAGNPKTTERLQKWERKEASKEKIIVGLTMIAVGAIILLFFV
ncbi:MAG: cytochrome c biogenesis CcdA family protein [Candidatus Peregrinibacteria bacterium]|nr:cytochrome c biogenesis CcdA family protein [Candidatus Peregrinibacteria bacterium]MDZ4244619.1 cytochrome c biogenesis CcdA family protein [Candidatus Gracilibacteria bacterium]